jgi:predicted P-loop ATPase
MRTAKAYFSSAEDRFRLPYGHRLGRFPRQSVMAGTTNQREYLQDMTGNRRYWPVACGEIDLQGIEADRDQLWAEAQTRFDRGERWWEETPEEKTLIGEQQGERVAGDVWETRIQEFLSNRLRACPPDRRLTLFVSMDSIMEQALGMAAKDMKRPEQTRVGIILQALGWAGTRPWVAGERVRGYRPGYRVLDAQASNPTATIGGDDDLPPF